MSNNYVAIMAGGVGSRFWPASREKTPKQFLDIFGVGKSLIRMTYERFLKVVPKEHIYVVTNERYRDLVKKHIPELSDNQILGEPSRNNTAPSVAYTAFKLHQINPKANFVIAPSDHLILQEDDFIGIIKKGLAFTAKNDALLTLGIQPTRPDTGYGYINFQKDSNHSIKKVIRFTEKPDKVTAEKFLASGDYVWNAGIFLWRTAVILSAFEKYAPGIYTILKKGAPVYNTPGEQAFIDANYPMTPSISVDFAIMENADNIYTFPSEFGWSDLGTWGSLYAESGKDSNNNVLQGDNIMAFDSQSNIVRAPKEKLVIIKDLNDYIVIDEEDALLIFPKGKEQEIKQVTTHLKEMKNDKYL